MLRGFFFSQCGKNLSSLSLIMIFFSFNLAAIPSRRARANPTALVFLGGLQREMATCQRSHRFEVVFFLYSSITYAEAFCGSNPKGNPNALGICISLETSNAECVSCCTTFCLTGLGKGGRPVFRQQLNICRCIMSCTHSLS